MSGPTMKSEFRNTRDYHIGVVLKREDGKMKGSALEPGGRVWMDEEEQMATANAPRAESDNPFVNGDLELVQSAQALANRRPIGDTQHPQQEVGGQVAEEAPPTAEPEPVGADGDDEEGATTGDPSEEETAPSEEEKAPEEPQEEPQGDGSRERTREQSEASARAAAARRRAPAANEDKVVPPPPPPDAKAPKQPETTGHTGTAPPPEGKPPEGSRPPAEEVATPGAVPSE